jgi:hypothetical protein
MNELTSVYDFRLGMSIYMPMCAKGKNKFYPVKFTIKKITISSVPPKGSEASLFLEGENGIVDFVVNDKHVNKVPRTAVACEKICKVKNGEQE